MNVVASASFSEACQVQKMTHLPESSGKGNQLQLPCLQDGENSITSAFSVSSSPSSSPTQPATKTKTTTTSMKENGKSQTSEKEQLPPIEAAVSLACMRRQHKNDPPLPTDVAQRIFGGGHDDSSALARLPSIPTSSEARDAASVLRAFSSTSELEFSTALDILSICREADFVRNQPVPISPSNSSRNNNKNVNMEESSIHCRNNLKRTKKRKRNAVSCNELTNSSKNCSKKSRKSSVTSSTSSKLASIKSLSSTTTSTTTNVGNSSNCVTTSKSLPLVVVQPVHTNRLRDVDILNTAESVILRYDIDPIDGAPTVVRTDGGVMREYKEHKLKNSSRRQPQEMEEDENGQPRPKHLSDQLLRDGELVVSKEDLLSYPTERQKKAYRTFIQRLNELRQYAQHYGDCTDK